MEKKVEVLTTRTETNASTSSTKTEKKPRTPCCARCRYHEKEIPVKDHKRYCRYRSCTCRGCNLVALRQRVMAKQVKDKRARDQDKKKIKVAGEDDPASDLVEDGNTAPDLATRFEDNSDNNDNDDNVHTGSGDAIKIRTLRKVSSSRPHTGSPNHLLQGQFGASAEFLLFYTIKLMELFHCPREMLVYMYVIVKYANGNLEEALNRILQGSCDIRRMSFWNEFRSLPRYCCTGYTGPTETRTYEGQLPYLGGTPPTSGIDLEIRPHTLNSHIPASRVPVVPESLPEHPVSVVDSPEFLLLQTTRLMQFFEVPWHMLIYVYVIVKGANGDFEEANRRVLQGSYEIRTMPIWNDFSMLPSSRYCCTRYAGSTDAPTYEGQVPYIGGTPPTNAIDLGPHPHTLNSHIPATRVPLRPESLPEPSASIDRLPTSR
ncbi:transcription factor doublesex isoform X2 [Lasioglossum baleicum]|uniref:transcription factor doublesex isoform X2 n=1 Tax=Lasioglossum baleicum TaxID=434251 RepID=UPI003FCD1C47